MNKENYDLKKAIREAVSEGIRLGFASFPQRQKEKDVDEDVLIAAKKIRAYCDNHICEECALFRGQKNGTVCVISSDIPCEWELQGGTK